jgi:hypothetical protein
LGINFVIGELKLPIKKNKQNNIDHLKTTAKNCSDMGHLTEKYGIQEEQAMPQEGEPDPLKKKRNTNKTSGRRYVVRAIAHSPLFSATMWTYACSKLASAERLFEQKLTSCEFDVLELLDRQDRNERTGEYRVLRSTTVKILPASGTRH